MSAPGVHREPLPGTRPEGARDAIEAAAQVREMFSGIAPRYDFLNHLLSLSLDKLWRRRTALRFREVLSRPEARVLDLCCGTGDLAFALERVRRRAGGTGAPVIGSDFAQPMLERASRKAHRSESRVVFAAADALKLPFADASVDLVTAAFGFRNLANYESGLREMARVLKPGGELGILEFAEPERGPMAAICRFYCRRVLPKIGGAISGNRAAYAYLPNSVTRFPSPEELAVLMERCGFESVKATRWNFGSVALHAARRARS
ncbi:MAG TPA: bifunctional demethylmenaquinone methyltransferase/2-methoxy-6-polyprenyl-1,4-benzoquinol methylase UbiE [Candidatus Acidoferrales bacterium]|nr:bifunctional demethylmenaquinone methyltransferase/2-methoxy-6-polyprenyl-1,4-benzoquinol methylase UbiE [Candidatus Acidoferrales bacterium]